MKKNSSRNQISLEDAITVIAEHFKKFEVNIERIDKSTQNLEDMVQRLQYIDKEAFSLKEAAKTFGFSYSFFHNKTTVTGEIPYVQGGHGEKIVVLKSDVLDFMKKKRQDWKEDQDQ